ncbi:MAG: DUF805 domain-containing protein [Ferrimicrobium sp.]|uniref:DUF805 domain-containing protein n=1 Tax=Ferrimicrobium sp. TaxID=2926050 RepID=UPI0026278485|nr:DUF805 domain-containing protein [Ferrimicrobium sp.]
MRVVPTTKDVSIKEAYLLYLLRWNDFHGRSSRQEFWKIVAINLVASLILSRLSYAVGLGGWIGLAFSLLNVIPVAALQTRRLHDAGHSGWWIVIGAAMSALFLVLVTVATVVARGTSGVYMMRSVAPVFLGLGLFGMAIFVLEIVIVVFDCQRGVVDNRYGPQMH